MTEFLQLVISGLMLGCIYALIAMGFVIVFKATNVVNFAHASIVMLGAFLVAKWHQSLGFFGAAAAAAVACALAAAVLDFLFVRPLRIKARGEGLYCPLDQFDVSVAPDKPAQLTESRVDPADAQRWAFKDIFAGDRYAATVAVEKNFSRLVLWEFIEGNATA